QNELARFFTLLRFFHYHYFTVNVLGVEHVPTRGRAMLAGNHAGGSATDAVLVIAAMFFEPEPPRLAPGMPEEFRNQAPVLRARAWRRAWPRSSSSRSRSSRRSPTASGR